MSPQLDLRRCVLAGCTPVLLALLTTAPVHADKSKWISDTIGSQKPPSPAAKPSPSPAPAPKSLAGPLTAVTAVFGYLRSGGSGPSIPDVVRGAVASADPQAVIDAIQSQAPAK
jgi:hypothetical protein